MMKHFTPWGLALLLLAAPAAAQRGTVSAGMSEAQVRSTFGEPAQVRRSAGWTYLFYLNGCASRCGSDDVVFLQDGRVVTAVLRTPSRRFAGPAAARALAGSDAGEARAPSPAPRGGARVEGIRIQVPRTENVNLGAGQDTIRPSVVGPFPGQTRRDSLAPVQPQRDDRGVRVPLPPPDTIDFSRPSGRGIPLPPPDTIDFSADSARIAPRRPAAARPRSR